MTAHEEINAMNEYSMGSPRAEQLLQAARDMQPVLRERAAKALINKASALIQLGRTDEARLAYEKVAATYGADPQPTLREQVAIARVRKEILEDSLS